MLARPRDPLFDFEPPPHPMIRASRVCGAGALARDGKPLGRLEDLALETRTGRVAYALLDTGSDLGSESALHPVPWSRMTFDAEAGVYRLGVDRDALRDAPPFRPDAVSGWDPTYWRTSAYDFHAPHAERPWWT